MAALMRFCEEHQLHLISDEIYGLSTWNGPQQTNKHTSALGVITEGVMSPSRLHVIWGPSKVCQRAQKSQSVGVDRVGSKLQWHAYRMYHQPAQRAAAQGS